MDPITENSGQLKNNQEQGRGSAGDIVKKCTEVNWGPPLQGA